MKMDGSLGSRFHYLSLNVGRQRIVHSTVVPESNNALSADAERSLFNQRIDGRNDHQGQNG